MAEAALTERTNVNVHLVTEEDSAKNVIVTFIFFISIIIFFYPLSPFYELVCRIRLDNPPSVAPIISLAVQLFQPPVCY